jgi:membrane fusion protein, multidrug efflux system
MSTIVKNILAGIIAFFLIGLAFYPKIKEKWLSPKEEKTATASPNSATNKANTNAKDGAPGIKASPKTMVKVTILENENLDDKIQTTGSMLANEEIEIRSEVSGRLVKLHLHEGTQVRRGTTLFEINNEDLKARLRKLQYNKKLAEDNEFRQKRLLEKEAISQREYDIAVNSVNTIQADIEDLQAQIAKYLVKAPFDGTVGLRYVSEGSYISPTTRIASITNTNPIKIEFSVPAKYSNIVRKGSKVYFRIEDDGPEYNATVYAVDPKIDPQTRTLQLRATAPNPLGKLIPGAFAKINIVLGTRGKAILIPTEAVIPEAGGAKVFLVQNGKAKSVKVKLGQRGDREVEVLEGLAKGDTLVTIGSMQLKQDGEVEIDEVLKKP